MTGKDEGHLQATFQPGCDEPPLCFTGVGVKLKLPTSSPLRLFCCYGLSEVVHPLLLSQWRSFALHLFGYTQYSYLQPVVIFFLYFWKVKINCAPVFWVFLNECSNDCLSHLCLHLLPSLSVLAWLLLSAVSFPSVYLPYCSPPNDRHPQWMQAALGPNQTIQERSVLQPSFSRLNRVPLTCSVFRRVLLAAEHSQL